MSCTLHAPPQVCLSCLFLQCRQIFARWNRCIALCLPRAYSDTEHRSGSASLNTLIWPHIHWWTVELKLTMHLVLGRRNRIHDSGIPLPRVITEHWCCCCCFIRFTLQAYQCFVKPHAGDNVTHSSVLDCSPLKPWNSPCNRVRHILHEYPEIPLRCKWSLCIASTSVSLTRCCTSTCVFRARSCPLPLLVKRRSCQRCIYNVEVNKPCSVWHAICRLSSASCPNNLLSPSLTSDA